MSRKICDGDSYSHCFYSCCSGYSCSPIFVMCATHAYKAKNSAGVGQGLRRWWLFVANANRPNAIARVLAGIDVVNKAANFKISVTVGDLVSPEFV